MISLFIVIGISAIALLVGGWLIYPAVTARRGRRVPVARTVTQGTPPTVTVILVSREDAAAIERRIDNLLQQDFPRDRCTFVVSLDASIADRATDVRALLHDRCTVVRGEKPGKSSALNAGVAASTSEIIVFVDTAQQFAPDVVSQLVREMDDQVWGALTATLAATSGDAFMDSYWQRELAVRKGQESKHSIICVTGCAYAMRRRYWRAMPVALICDDLWSTYGVVTHGGRVGIVSTAHVVDPRRFTREQEYARRLRTMTGMLQFIRSSPEVLLPWRNPMWSDFLLHKLIRPATPLLLFAATISFGVVLWMWQPKLLLGAAVAIAAISITVAVAAAIAPTRVGRHLATLRFAQRLMLMPALAILRALRSDWDVWHAPNAT